MKRKKQTAKTPYSTVFSSLNSVVKINWKNIAILMTTAVIAFVLIFQLGIFVLSTIYITPKADYSGGSPTRTWDNGSGDNNWSNPVNWSGDTLPTTNDVAIFASSNTSNATINTAIDVKGIYINSGYTGTISNPSAYNITIGSDGFTQNDGVFSNSSDGPTNSNLQAYWNLDEGTGTSVTDSSGNSRHGTTSSAAIVAGNPGNARHISNVSTGYISVPAISMSGDWTISAQVLFPLPLTAGSWRTLAVQSGGNYHHIIIHNDGSLGSYNSGWYPSGYNVNSLTGWHNLVAVAEGSTTKFYIDGSLVGTSGTKTGATVSMLGNYAPGGQQEFGTFDEVRIYSSALDSTQVANLNKGLTYINGSLNIISGSFVAPSNLLVAGNWSNTGTFSHNEGTVKLIGTNQSINGSTTFKNFQKIASSSDTLTFPGNSSVSQTFAGSLILRGTSDQLLLLRSSASPNQWKINVLGAHELAYVDIKDAINISPTAVFIDGDSSINSGNNSDFGFFGCLTGGSHVGDDWNPEGCTGGIAGVHTDIDNFLVESGDLINVKEYNGTSYGSLSIQANSVSIEGTINGASVGYRANTTGIATDSGPGGSACGGDSRAGASHAGVGGISLYGIYPAQPYGTAASPVTMGSGGGLQNCTGPGSHGGGAIKIASETTFSLTGVISVNGGDSIYGRSGAGAGGSLWLITDVFSGNGTLRANGGNPVDFYGTGGGGGRISINYGSSTFNGTVTVTGGAGPGGGGGTGSNGTILYHETSSNDLYIRNSQSWYSNPAVDGAIHNYRDIYIENNSTLTLNGYYTNNNDDVGFTFNIRNLNVASGSTLGGSGGGFKGTLASRTGDGPGGAGTQPCPWYDSASGGGHGGIGGNSIYGDKPGYPYGSAFNPIRLGSAGGAGGGAGGCGAIAGGSGGTAIRVNSSGTIQNNGAISANGSNGNGGRSGAGAGGSVYLITSTLSGDGSITANGGNISDFYPGVGSGGRILIKYSSANNFSGTITANSGTGSGYGLAQNGTLIIQDTTNNDIYIPTTQFWSADPTREGGTHNYRNFYVQNTASLNLIGHYTSNVNGFGHTINVTNLTINTGASISANGGGYLGGKSTNGILTNTLADGAGPGGGQGNNCSGTFYAGSGSYGGTGGNSSALAYGSNTAPVDLGSGGGAGSNGGTCVAGAMGGGAIRITATDTLTVNGNITANGDNSTSTYAGSGAGGSVYITAGTIESSPTATIYARGGSSPCGACTSDGGGGRIAVYFTSANNWQGSEITPTNAARAGQGGTGGEDGTVFIGQASIPNITSLRQYRSNCSTVINVGGGTSQSDICLGGTISSGDNPDNLIVEFEFKAIGVAFTGIPNGSTAPIPFVGTPVTFSQVISGVNIGTSYHWQIRAQNEDGVYSGWISFGDNSEADADFIGQYPTVAFNSASASNSEGLINPVINVSLGDTISAIVTVNYSVTGGTAISGDDFTLESGTLTFPADTLTQAIPLEIIDDVIQRANSTVIITLSNPSNATLGGITEYTYTIINNDAAGFIISQNTGGNNQVVEDGVSDNYFIRLNTSPASSVTLDLTANANFEYSTPSLTFSMGDWNVNQEISVSAVDDLIAQGNRYSVINHTVTSDDPFYDNYNLGGVGFSIVDNDVVGVQLNGATTRDVGESCCGTTVQIVLTSQPEEDVVVTFNKTNSAINFASPSMTFTPSNWFTAQNNFVSVVDDSIAQGNHSSGITFTTTSDDVNYDGFELTPISINIIDNDSIGAIVTTSLSLTEGTAAQNAYVRLNSQPTEDVTVSISTNSQVTINPTSRTFTSSNWNVNQAIAIGAIHDFVANGNRGITLNYTATSDDEDYDGITISDLSISIADIDEPNVSISETIGGTIISEGGATDTYSIQLTTQPSSNVTINLAPSNPEVIVNPTSIEFTDENWDQPQSINLSIERNFVMNGTRARTISHTASSNDPTYDEMTISNVTVVVNDVDVAGFSVTETSGGTYTTEGGSSDSFNIVLTSKPTFNVVINTTPNSQLIISPTSLVFTSANWNVPQSIGVSAVNDLIAQGNRTTNLDLTPTSSDGNYGALSTQFVNVSITDNDFAGVLITQSGGSTNVVKGADTDTYTVVLTAQPQASVTINLTPQAPLQVTPTSLIFTAGNWNTPRTITVSATDNGVVEAAFARQIENTISSSDLHYNALSPEIVSAQIYSVTPPQGSASKTDITQDLNNEVGYNDYEISLGSQPSADVVVNIIVDSNAISYIPQSITFTTSNWNVPQTISLTFDPTLILNTGLATEIHHQIVTSDPGYSSIMISDITLNIANTGGPTQFPEETPPVEPTVTTTPVVTPTVTIPTINPTATFSPTNVPSISPTLTSVIEPSQTPSVTPTTTIIPPVSSDDEENRETVISILAETAGPLSPIILILFTPFLYLIIALAISLLTSIAELVVVAGGVSRGKIIDSITKEGLNFVKVEIMNPVSGRKITRISLFGGQIAAKLDFGSNRILVTKDSYIPTEIQYEAKSQNEMINGDFPMEQEEEKDLFYRLQFNVSKISIPLVASIFATIFSFVNIIFNQSWWGIGLLIISLASLLWSIFKSSEKHLTPPTII